MSPMQWPIPAPTKHISRGGEGWKRGEGCPCLCALLACMSGMEGGGGCAVATCVPMPCWGIDEGPCSCINGTGGKGGGKSCPHPLSCSSECRQGEERGGIPFMHCPAFLFCAQRWGGESPAWKGEETEYPHPAHIVNGGAPIGAQAGATWQPGGVGVREYSFHPVCTQSTNVGST